MGIVGVLPRLILHLWAYWLGSLDKDRLTPDSMDVQRRMRLISMPLTKEISCETC